LKTTSMWHRASPHMGYCSVRLNNDTNVARLLGQTSLTDGGGRRGSNWHCQGTGMAAEQPMGPVVWGDPGDMGGG
jgi:hypothetical protein